MQSVTVKQESIILMNGAMGTGKSTLCGKLFDSHHIVSTDKIRQEFSGDFNDMRYGDEVFDIVYCIIEQRMKAGVFTVVDSTASNGMVNRVAEIAKRYNREVTVLRMPELTEDQVTEERMKHRMAYLEIYHNQVERCRKQTFPNNFNVVDIQDVSEFGVKIERNFDVCLPNGHDYTIIGDVHGEYHLVLKLLEERPKIDKLIFLGDIVDRGLSSYKTFRLVSELVNSGRAHMVPGNHDNKLMRYFKKFLKDDNTDKYNMPATPQDVQTYGMKLAHGLTGTLMEFYEMNVVGMDAYATDFVQFYNQLPPYLRLESGGTVHLFAHAGLTRNIIEERALTKGDLSAVLYRTMNLEDFEDMELDLKDTFVTIHLGHEVVEPELRLQVNKDHTVIVYKHDLGMGKEKLKSITNAVVSIRA